MTDHRIDLGDDDGYVTVCVAGSEQRLDLYDVYTNLLDIFAGHQDSAAGCNAALADYLKGKGFPEVSHYAADQFARQVFARVEALRKNSVAGAGAGSPAPAADASTAPTTSG
jgi:hypothetical protein